MTIDQIQHLLAYLGYYAGTVDGIWGTLSKTACKSFQKDSGLDIDGIAGEATQNAMKQAVACDMEKQAPGGTFWDAIKYFRRQEFRCPCGKCSGFPAEPAEMLVKAADSTREHFGNPVSVSSGVRCTAHNAQVGGVSNSRHLSGKAMDFSVRGVSAPSVLTYIQQLPGIRYAYAIDGSYVHMDIL